MSRYQQLKSLVESDYTRDDLPYFRAGDTINVHYRIREGDKERIQQFLGVVIQRRGSAGTETVTVRKMSSGVGVERVIPVHSPMVEKIEVRKYGFVRRARIFYLRERRGKSARIKAAKSTPKLAVIRQQELDERARIAAEAAEREAAAARAEAEAAKRAEEEAQRKAEEEAKAAEAEAKRKAEEEAKAAAEAAAAEAEAPAEEAPGAETEAPAEEGEEKKD